MKIITAIIFVMAALFFCACASNKKPTRTNAAGKQTPWVTPAPYEGALPGMGAGATPRNY